MSKRIYVVSEIHGYYDLFINNNSKNIISYPLLLPMKGFITSNQLEKLFKDLEPIFDICKQVFELGIKNYKFLLEANKDK